MPYIKIVNLNKEQVNVFSKNVKNNIAEIVGIPESRFHFFHCGELLLEEYLVLIEILWYPRDESKMEKVAGLINSEIKKLGDYDAHVIFHEINSNKHYINGKQHIHIPES